MDEFDLIGRYFKPLARQYSGALNLTDDAALVTIPTGHELVITKDAISEGIHFIGNEDPALIAKKLLRVNLSDLAAMGATPLAYFLACILPKNCSEAWLQRFTAGLAEEQAAFAIHLAGGDTISTNGPLSLSLTALGTVPAGKALKRSTAQAGDTIFISGTLGDSALGLAMLQSAKQTEDFPFLKQRYFLPEPRITLGQQLLGIASAVMDISDGLMQDIGHICTASGLGALMYQNTLPLSPDAATLVKADPFVWNAVMNGGDDYELLFTVPTKKIPQVAAIAQKLQLPLTPIGQMTADIAIRMLDKEGHPIAIQRAGYRHFY